MTTKQRVGSQHSSHDMLMKDRSGDTASSGRKGQLDAIIVPAARLAHYLRYAIKLAAQSNSPLVVIGSGSCEIADVAQLVAAQPGAAAVLIEAPSGDDVHPALRLDTSSQHFRKLTAGRTSDLSLKRNLGLLLARLRGWRKVLFLDDDVRSLTAEQVRKVATQLDAHRIAGLRTIRFPDNSVVCHARRLVGQTQGIFVSGAALGVNCSDLPLELMVDMYNEDWFAMYREAAAGGVTCVGDVRQLSFNPFADPERAACEEFGDILAEGLFALLHEGDGLSKATRQFWQTFVDDREGLVLSLQEQLLSRETHESLQAYQSLQRSHEQLQLVSPSDCLDFIDAWNRDKAHFENLSNRMHPMGTLPAAMDELGIRTWQESEFAAPVVDRRYPPVGQRSRGR